MKDNEFYDLILLNIGYAVHHANWNYQNVYSPFARIFFVKEGTAQLHIRANVYNLVPGHLYMIPPPLPAIAISARGIIRIFICIFANLRIRTAGCSRILFSRPKFRPFPWMPS